MAASQLSFIRALFAFPRTFPPLPTPLFAFFPSPLFFSFPPLFTLSPPLSFVLTQWGATLVIQLRERERERDTFSDAAQLLRGATQAFGATRARLLQENLGDFAPKGVGGIQII